MQAESLGDVRCLLRQVVTMRWKASYSPACIAAARSARPASSRTVPAAGSGPAHGGLRAAPSGVATLRAPRGLPVGIVGVAAQFIDRPFKHLAQLRRDRHSHLGHIDVEHRVEVGIEIQRRSGKFRVLVYTAYPVPAAPLDEPLGAVNVKALLPVPVQRT